MKNNSEPFYRIQKQVFEGFCLALSQNYDDKTSAKRLIKVYGKVQEGIDSRFPRSNRRARDTMKEICWATFFNGLLNNDFPVKKTFKFNKKGVVTWHNKETDKDITTKMYFRMLGGACRCIIDETGVDHLQMFEQVFKDLELNNLKK